MDLKSLIFLRELYIPDLYYSHMKISKIKYNKIKKIFELEKEDLSLMGLTDDDMIVLNNNNLGFQIVEHLEPFFYKKNNTKENNFYVKTKKQYRINFNENSINIISALIEKIEISENLNIVDNKKTKRRL